MNIRIYINMIFYFVMSLTFLFSFIFPFETDFWLATNGLAVLLAELFSIFIFFTLFNLKNRMFSGSFPFLSNPYVKFLSMVIFSFVFLFSISGLWVALYFIVSQIFKIISRYGSESNLSEHFLRLVFYGGLLLIALIPAYILSLPLNLMFSEQNLLFSDSIIYEFSDNMSPLFLAFWGFFYFILLIWFSYRELKTYEKYSKNPKPVKDNVK